MELQWITWALQGLIALVLIVILRKIDENEKSVIALTLALAKHYVHKDDWERVRVRLHEVENYIAGEKAIKALRAT